MTETFSSAEYGKRAVTIKITIVMLLQLLQGRVRQHQKLVSATTGAPKVPHLALGRQVAFLAIKIPFIVKK